MATDFVVSRQVYVDAFRRGMNASAFLETLDPSSRYAEQDLREMGRDAFTRKMREMDIVTRSIPEMGLRSHTVERFFDDSDGNGEQRRALFPEWMSRVYRQATRVVPRGRFESQAPQLNIGNRQLLTQNPLSDIVWPEAMDASVRYQQLEPSILSFLVGSTRLIDSDVFKAFYLDDTAMQSAAHMKRISEYGEISGLRITGSDETIRAHKYGRKIMASYEAMRRMSLDLLAFAIQYVGMLADNDKALHAIDVIVNGDGNTGTAATNTNGSTLDAAAGGALTLKMWLAWGMLWTRPHMCNLQFAQNAGILQLLLLNAGSANLPPGAIVTPSGALGQVSLVRPIYGSIQAFHESTSPANKLVGFDNRLTLEMVVEAGADITEVDRVITAQYEQVVISEVVGFGIMIRGQNRTLAYTA